MKCASCGKNNTDKYHICDTQITENNDPKVKTSSFEEVKKKAEEELSKNRRAPRGW